MKNTLMAKNQVQSATDTVMQRLLREGSLIIYILMAVLLLIALGSYSASDPGFTTTGSGDEVQNLVGRYGAWVADVLLHLLGYLAYTLPAFLAYKVYAYFFRDNDHETDFSWTLLILKILGFLLLMVAACGLATLHFEIGPTQPFLAGGVIGSMVVDLCLPVFASLGCTLLFFAVFLLGLTITVELSWLKLIDGIGARTLAVLSLIVLRLNKWSQGRKHEQLAIDRQQIRKQSLEQHKHKHSPRIAPTITEPKVAKPVKNKRVQKENQQQLFTTSAVKELPAISLLDAWEEGRQSGFSKQSLKDMSKLLEVKLKDFGIEIEVTAVHPGPVITRFEVQPAPGIKASRISNLVKDLARSLAVVSVRVVEVIPGKTVIGIEVPNEQREIILLSQVLSTPDFERASSPLSMALGHDIVGKPVIVDLGKMPHLLVAGTTGSGKSVGINAMILSLMFKSTPDQVRMIMIDPKMLELSVYDGIPHLLTPVITDMKDAANGLRWCVAEMDRRYKLLSALGVRNLAGFNKQVTDSKKTGKPLPDPLWQPDPMIAQEEQSAPLLEPLPQIVVIVDELADMMMVVGKKVEDLIARIAQKARAAGIHLILATQRPSVDVLTGLIKANVPTRLSFMVQSKVDSRTILGDGGAEQLLGNGDMLFLPPGGGVATRVHGAFVSDEEVHRVVADWKQRGAPNYLEDIIQGADESDSGGSGFGEGDEEDALYDEAVSFVTETRKASISAVQRKLRIGYNRAARMIESMEAAGVVSGMGSNGAREVIAPPPPRS